MNIFQAYLCALKYGTNKLRILLPLLFVCEVLIKVLDFVIDLANKFCMKLADWAGRVDYANCLEKR